MDSVSHYSSSPHSRKTRVMPERVEHRCQTEKLIGGTPGLGLTCFPSKAVGDLLLTPKGVESGECWKSYAVHSYWD